MVKFFDINAGQSETPSSKKAEVKNDADESKKNEVKAEDTDNKTAAEVSAEPLRPDYSVGEPSKDDTSEPSVVASKPTDESKPDEMASNKDDDVMPKAPEIPRATPAMAPKNPVNHSPLSPILGSTHQNKQKVVTAILSITLIVLLGLLVSQAVIYFTQTKKDSGAIVPKTDTTPTDTANTDTTKTTTPEVAKPVIVSTALTKDKAILKVLNGGGVAGAGAKAASVLKTAGFTVSSTSNAKSYTYATTEVLYKNDDAKDVASEVVTALKGYGVEAKLDETTPSSATEIVVIVGKK